MAESSDMKVRAATLGDMAAITRIYADAVSNGTASYEIEPPDRDEMERRFLTLTADGFPYLVAEGGEVLLGYAYAAPFRTRAAYRFIVEDSIYVAPEAQGRGIGRKLLERLIEEAGRRGFRQIVAVIGDGHAESASVLLHEKLGFRHSGRLEGSGYKHGRWLDTVFMQLAINGGASSAPAERISAKRDI